MQQDVEPALWELRGQESMMARIQKPRHRTPINERILSLEIWDWFDKKKVCTFCGEAHVEVCPEWTVTW